MTTCIFKDSWSFSRVSFSKKNRELRWKNSYKHINHMIGGMFTIILKPHIHFRTILRYIIVFYRVRIVITVKFYNTIFNLIYIVFFNWFNSIYIHPIGKKWHYFKTSCYLPSKLIFCNEKQLFYKNKI